MTQARPESARLEAERAAGSCAGLVLAAGDGTRFGSSSSKLLAPLDGRPLLEHAVRAQCGVLALSRVVVVLGAYAPELLDAVEFGRAERVVFEGWRAGQSASLRFGLGALAGTDKVIVTLGDAPLVSSETIARFVDEAPGARAAYDGRPGHPVVLGSEEIEATRSIRGDRGAREVLRGGPLIECGALCSDRDVDTPEDLKAIRNQARAVL